MNVFDVMRQSANFSSSDAGEPDALSLLEDELSEGLSLFWDTAQEILSGSGIFLKDKPAGFLDLENNFFSAIFLYSYHRAGIARNRRVMYAALNHCLRGMVTGCDNILDDEYKKTLETDLPEGAVRFRSIIDIMASDRVLFSIVMAACARKELSPEQVLQASTASLHTLTASGIQEAAEEQGIDGILSPEDILGKIHHYKTGLLFNCPWGIPSVLEQLDSGIVDSIKEALYRIGIGCQIMDDMADLARDTRMSRHNYVASVIYHRTGPESWHELKKKAVSGSGDNDKEALLTAFPAALEESARQAQRYLFDGLHALFGEQHAFAVQPSISFLYERIGTADLMDAAGLPV